MIEPENGVYLVLFKIGLLVLVEETGQNDFMFFEGKIHDETE